MEVGISGSENLMEVSNTDSRTLYEIRSKLLLNIPEFSLIWFGDNSFFFQRFLVRLINSFHMLMISKRIKAHARFWRFGFCHQLFMTVKIQREEKQKSTILGQLFLFSNFRTFWKFSNRF